MIVGRLVGWLLIIAALVAEGRDLWAWADTHQFQVSPLGLLWHQLSPNTLLFAQFGVQLHVEPFIGHWLWDPVISTILLTPAVLILAVPGILLVWLFRRRERRRRH